MSQDAAFLPRAQFQRLFDLLHEAGYRCVGPQLRDGAIVYDTLTGPAALPGAVRDVQAPGSYRTRSAEADRCFAWANGPQALKPLVFRPEELLWQARRDAAGHVEFSVPEHEAEPLAVIGVRACDIAALYIHDKHFLHGSYREPIYLARRQNLCLVAVHCTHPASTCFCASTGDGPAATYGFDLALSELDDGFIVEARSDQGVRLLAGLPIVAASAQQQELADAAVGAAARQQRRSLPGRNLRDALFANLAHRRWDEVGARCLSCGNCTAVCPTCFCHGEEDRPALDGARSEHYRQWDSCFTQGHSYIHGITIRAGTAHRYRQWLTHKLGSWHDQYGRSGCVGCGRCITWCPVGIDLTEEVAAICAGDADA